MGRAADGHARLADVIGRHRQKLLDQLTQLEWSVDPENPQLLVRGPEKVLARAELFLGLLERGLASGDWAAFERTIAARTTALLVDGVISASDLNARAQRIAGFLIPHVIEEDDPVPLLEALFETMQALSGRIVADYNERVLAESQRLDDLKTMFLRMTGHELRAPLSVIRGWVSMLRSGDLGPITPASEKALRAIELATASSLSMLDRLGEVARLESSAEAIQRTQTSVAEVLETAVAGLRGAAAQKGVQLAVRGASGEASMDVAAIVIALRNLLGNALKYAPEGPVEITGRREGRDVVFEVADHGQGIPLDQVELVFDRYHRVPGAAHAEIPGSGLGLYVVRRIAELHGGTATVENASDGGAIFSLRFPAEAAVTVPAAG